MKINYMAAAAMMLTASAGALPDGWKSSPASDGSDVSFFVNRSKIITLAPVEDAGLSLDQMGEEMRNFYDNLGFDCRTLHRGMHMVNFDCVKMNNRNPELPSSVGIYLLEKDHRVTAASLVGGASLDDLRQIMGVDSL